jgi:hypothetical protein
MAGAVCALPGEPISFIDAASREMRAGAVERIIIMPTATPAKKSTAKPAAKAPEKTKVLVSATETKPVEKAPEKPAKPTPLAIDYDGFLAKLTPKDRLNIERHIAAIEELSTRNHAKLWKRLATAMMSMAPHSAKANGQQSMQFYIQDGKYRMQIFAIEDLRDGTVHVYAADAIDEATKAGMFIKSKPGDEPNELRLAGSTDTLNVERLDGKVSNPAPFYKDMLGWNRRAIHISLPVMASETQAEATHKLLVMGAKKAGAIA